MSRLFGTDGVRGVHGKDLTNKMAYCLAMAGASILGSNALICMDTRISGRVLSYYIEKGINKAGAVSKNLGVLPTPALAYNVREHNADFGIVISASHNPYQYNGIKFFDSKGMKLSDEVEDKIEAKYHEFLSNPSLDSELKELEIQRPKFGDYNFSSDEESAVSYIDFLTTAVDLDLNGLTIALDMANGALFTIASVAFAKLGASVLCFGNHPNGININDRVGSTHIEEFKVWLGSQAYDLAFTFDGDGDRMLCLDKKGRIIDGDLVMLALGIHLKEQNLLPDNTIVATVMSNLGFEKAAIDCGLRVVRANVGDRYVLEMMLQNGYALGGEQSGHTISLRHNTTGDGLLTSLLFVKALRSLGKSAEDIVDMVTPMPQVLKNAKVSNDKKLTYENNEEFKYEFFRLKEKYGNNGRILIRPSGTEPLVRVMIEGENQHEIYQDASILATLIEKISH